VIALRERICGVGQTNTLEFIRKTGLIGQCAAQVSPILHPAPGHNIIQGCRRVHFMGKMSMIHTPVLKRLHKFSKTSFTLSLMQYPAQLLLDEYPLEIF